MSTRPKGLKYKIKVKNRAWFTSEKLKGNKFAKGHKPNITSFKKGEHKSPQTEFKKGQLSKENNPNWKGGITPIKKQIRHCFEYRQWISDVFTRDDFTCVNCEKRGGILNAHHIKPFSNILEEYKIKSLNDALVCSELWNINNGITLCKKCHYGK